MLKVIVSRPTEKTGWGWDFSAGTLNIKSVREDSPAQAATNENAELSERIQGNLPTLLAEVDGVAVATIKEAGKELAGKLSAEFTFSTEVPRTETPRAVPSRPARPDSNSNNNADIEKLNSSEFEGFRVKLTRESMVQSWGLRFSGGNSLVVRGITQDTPAGFTSALRRAQMPLLIHTVNGNVVKTGSDVKKYMSEGNVASVEFIKCTNTVLSKLPTDQGFGMGFVEDLEPVTVDVVGEETPAARAGITEGVIIAAVNGNGVNSVSGLVDEIVAHGDKGDMKVAIFTAPPANGEQRKILTSESSAFETKLSKGSGGNVGRGGAYGGRGRGGNERDGRGGRGRGFDGRGRGRGMGRGGDYHGRGGGGEQHAPRPSFASERNRFQPIELPSLPTFTGRKPDMDFVMNEALHSLKGIRAARPLFNEADPTYKNLVTTLIEAGITDAHAMAGRINDIPNRFGILSRLYAMGDNGANCLGYASRRVVTLQRFGDEDPSAYNALEGFAASSIFIEENLEDGTFKKGDVALLTTSEAALALSNGNFGCFDAVNADLDPKFSRLPESANNGTTTKPAEVFASEKAGLGLIKAGRIDNENVKPNFATSMGLPLLADSATINVVGGPIAMATPFGMTAVASCVLEESKNKKVPALGTVHLSTQSGAFNPVVLAGTPLFFQNQVAGLVTKSQMCGEAPSAVTFKRLATKSLTKAAFKKLL